MDTLVTVPAAVDTTTLLFVADFLSQAFPWLDVQVINWVSKFLAGIPIVALILGYEVVARLLRSGMPVVNALGSQLEKFSWIINPVLAAILGGQLMGDSTVGFAAGTLWTMLRKLPGGTTVHGLTKAKNIAVAAILGLMLLGSNASAQTMTKEAVDQYNKALYPLGYQVTQLPGTVSWLSPLRFSYGVGVGQRYEMIDGDVDTHNFGAGQLGYQAWDHLGLRGRVDRDFDSDTNIWNFELSAWVMF